jgi:hypothetical protein
MTLDADEFMRRFLLHVLPSGFHRIRHFGLISNTGRRENLARARELLNISPVEPKEIDAPMRGSVVLLSETHTVWSQRQREILLVQFKRYCWNDVIVRQFGLIDVLSDSVELKSP